MLANELTAVLAALLVTYVVQLLVRRYIRYRRYILPPGPTGLPFIGHLRSVNHLSLLDHREKYGDVSYMNILGTDVVVLNSLKVIRDAFQGQTAEVFSARPKTFITDFFIKEDIVFSSLQSDNWKPRRQMFHSLLKQYGEGKENMERVVNQELNVVREKLKTRIGDEFDIAEYSKASLVNILIILAVGKNYDYDSELVKAFHESACLGNKLASPFAEFILRAFPFLRFLPFGPGSIFKHVLQLRDFCLGYLFDEPRLKFEHYPSEGTGVVYELLRAQKTVPWLSNDSIKGLLQNMFGAGFLTSDGSLRTFFLVLLHHDDIQKRIQGEIDETIGRDRPPSLQDRSSMPYTIAAILELSRYSSVVALSVPHACAKDTDFRGFTIPRDAIILPNLFRTHHDHEVWENPWRFDPTRFLDDAGNLRPATHPTRQNLIAFGVGKRTCIGEVFAKTRLFLYITSILQEFTLKPTDNLPSCDPRDLIPDLVLSTVPYKLRIERRCP